MLKETKSIKSIGSELKSNIYYMMSRNLLTENENNKN